MEKQSSKSILTYSRRSCSEKSIAPISFLQRMSEGKVGYPNVINEDATLRQQHDFRGVKRSRPLAVSVHQECRRVSVVRRAVSEEPERNSHYQGAVMDRAHEIAAKLPPKIPERFLITMIHSHVNIGYWLGLPPELCLFMPEVESTIVLEDESGKEFKTNYLSHRKALSGGWRGFVTNHKLHEGDVLVFSLVEALKFKVHIFRQENIGELNITPAADLSEDDSLDSEDYGLFGIDHKRDNELDDALSDYVGPLLSEVGLSS